MPGTLPVESASDYNGIIGRPDWSDAATIVDASAAETGTSAANLLTDQPTEVYASSGTSGTVTVILDAGSARPWNVAALLYHDAPTNSLTWRARGASTQAGTSSAPDYDSDLLSQWWSPGMTAWARKHGVLWLGRTPRSDRFLRFDIETSDILTIGCLFIGNLHQGVRNHDFGYGTSWLDRSKRQEAGAITHVREIRPTLRRLRFTMRNQTEDDAMMLDELDRVCGGSRPVFVCLDPLNATHRVRKMAYGLLEPGAEVVHVYRGGYEKDFVVTALG